MLEDSNKDSEVKMCLSLSSLQAVATKQRGIAEPSRRVPGANRAPRLEAESNTTLADGGADGKLRHEEAQPKCNGRSGLRLVRRCDGGGVPC